MRCTCLLIQHYAAAAAVAKSLQSCPTLCDPIDSSPPGSPVPGILQARTLEWVAISFFNAWKWKVKVKLLSRVWLLATLWTAAYQAPPSIGFSRQEYWSVVPLPSPIGTATYLLTNIYSCSLWGAGPFLCPEIATSLCLILEFYQISITVLWPVAHKPPFHSFIHTICQAGIL